MTCKSEPVRQGSGTAIAPALCKTLAAECAALQRAIVVSVPRGTSIGIICEYVKAEAHHSSCVLDSEVSYDDSGQRYVRRYTSIGAQLMEEAVNIPIGTSFFESGMFVVTGGLGAIGQGIVQMLLDRVPSVYVLIIGSRSAAQASEQLCSLGWAEDSRVHYEAVNLGSDYRALLEALRHRLDGSPNGTWPIRAVLHLAGVYDRATLAKLSAETLATTMAAKVHGAVHLHDAALELGQRPIFIHFGSLVSVLSGVGLGSYAASNAFLEWFASFQRVVYGLDARCYVWTRWAETGIGVKFDLPDDVVRSAAGLETIDAAQGRALIRTLLERCPTHKE
eukprot:5800807-Prymnesium_polylepis.1